MAELTEMPIMTIYKEKSCMGHRYRRVMYTSVGEVY